MNHFLAYFLQQSENPIFQFLPIILIFVVIFLFFIRPQLKKQKQEKSFQTDLKKGQRVVTTSGIHGKINEMNENTVIIETGAGKITFEKAAISREFTLARFPESPVAK